MSWVKKLTIVVLGLVLSACITQQQAIKPYPKAPNELMTAPLHLKTLPQETNLEDVSTTITYNYGLYNKLAEQLKSLQEWTIKVREESLNVTGTN